MSCRTIMMLGCMAALAVGVAPAAGQVGDYEIFEVNTGFDSGLVANDGAKRGVIFSTLVQVPGAAWVRLALDEAMLGEAPAGGEATVLRVTSLLDGARQNLRAEHLVQWKDTTAYFNGNAVLVEIVADPGTAASRVKSSFGTAGPLAPEPAVDTICGTTDDRVLSQDARIGRGFPTACTAWMIDDTNHCFLTAGHCAGPGLDVIEFNVPLSSSSGAHQHPGPEDQYNVDPVSIQTNFGQGIGDDWTYFGCFENTETGLTPYEAQGAYFVLAVAPPPVLGQQIRITGYGATDPPVPETWNGAQKTHVGPYVAAFGTTVQYQTDTTSGNSGSPVIDESTGLAIGIHTHGGCNATRGQNQGTAINHPGIQNALANPLGVCLPQGSLTFSYPGGLPEVVDPGGAVLQVQVTGADGGTPQPGTGTLHYDLADGNGFTSVAMKELEANLYEAQFPAMPCGATIDFFFSAETVEAETIRDPLGAPADVYTALAVEGIAVDFSDDFEIDQGWTVTSEELTGGGWERGVPAGDGTRGDPTVDADGSGQCYLTGNTAGDSDVDGGPTRLTSPAIDATVFGDPRFEYHRWLATDDDVLIVELSGNDGADWTLAETVGSGVGWEMASIRVVDFMAPTSSMRLRFTVSDNPNNSITEAGIDGVRLVEWSCGLTGDIDGDGNVNFADLLLLIGAWGPCPAPPAPTCPADLNGDGSVTFADVLILLANWT